MEKQFHVVVANTTHYDFAQLICDEMEASARVRGTGIAKREPSYIRKKMEEGKAIIAFSQEGYWAGFCYIESWSNSNYVANSGLIVAPAYRKHGVAKLIKRKVFELSRRLYPHAKLFGLTTGLAVMKINSDLGYTPVTYSELTQDDMFWAGCKSCVNYAILLQKERKNCLCTAMLYDPAEQAPEPGKSSFNRPAKKIFAPIRFFRTLGRSLAARKSTSKKRIMKKVVLAYSGGLDTTFCAVYLKQELQLEVHAVTINTGGFSGSELQEIRERAQALGIASFTAIDVTEQYYADCVKYLLFGNMLKNGTYPLSVSAERIVQAVALARFARSVNAGLIAHGSTGAGNDQVRFDGIFQIMLPEVKILTPIRDLKLSREDEVNYLKQHQVDYDFKKSVYSINKGLWGTSVGGKETLTSAAYLPEDAWPTPITKSGSEEIELEFRRGEPVALNGKAVTHPVALIQALQQMAQPYGIGRDIHVGDTIIGIKGRVGFEAGAPLLLIKAHHLLEKHTLTKWQLYWKDQLSTWYANWLHEGQFLDPVMRNIEKLLADTQQTVSGKVFIRLEPKLFTLLGIESPHDLMNSRFGTYGEMNRGWTGEDVRGFTKILNNQTTLFHQVNKNQLSYD